MPGHCLARRLEGTRADVPVPAVRVMLRRLLYEREAPREQLCGPFYSSQQAWLVSYRTLGRWAPDSFGLFLEAQDLEEPRQGSPQ